MSVVKMRTRVRRKILVAGAMPLAIIGVPLTILLVSQLQSLGHLERASRQMLEQAATRVAEDLAQQIQEEVAFDALRLLRTIPEPVVRGGEGDPLRAVLPEGLGPAIRLGRAFLGVSRGGAARADTLELRALFFLGAGGPGGAGTVPVRAARGRSGFVGGRVELQSGLDLPIRVAVREALDARVTEVSRIVAGPDGKTVLLALRALHSSDRSSQASHFVGLMLPIDELVRAYFPVIVGELRSGEPPLGGGESLEVSIVDDRGRERYRTGASLLEAHVHQASLRFEFRGDRQPGASPGAVAPAGSWAVLAGYPGTDAAALARSSTNQQRHFLLLVSVVAAVGIALTGRGISRELGLSELKAEFVSSISHDLKTPLASIQLLAENLPSLQSIDRVERYGRVIGSEARKLGKLIDDILEFEKIAGGSRMYRGAEIDLRQPLRAAIGEFSAQLRETGFCTELRMPPERVRFVGDADALTHAFSNVIGNAIKYSEDERYLRVEMSLRDRNAVIEIHDHGRGIPPAERRKVFERFYRVRLDSGTDPAGTGLGLSITEHVVRCHGGRVAVAGEPGGGSVFTIEIPLSHALLKRGVGDG